MSTPNNPLIDTVDLQIQALTDAYTKMQIQLFYIQKEISCSVFSREVIESRKKQMEKAMDAVQETIFFLQNLNSTMGARYVKSAAI